MWICVCVCVWVCVDNCFGVTVLVQSLVTHSHLLYLNSKYEIKD